MSERKRATVAGKPTGVRGVGEWPVHPSRIGDQKVRSGRERERRRERSLARRRGARRRHVDELAAAHIDRRSPGVVDLHVFVRGGGSARDRLRQYQTS